MVRLVPLWLKVIPIYLMIGALLGLPVWLHSRDVSAIRAASIQTLNKVATHSPSVQSISGTPVRIVLPSVAIDLQIIPGYYSTQQKTWFINANGATYATNTYPANNTHGTTLIYGHYLNWIFGKTDGLKIGDKALVYTGNGHIFVYDMVKSDIFTPSNTQIFGELNTDKPILKVLTCHGLWSQTRRVMTFQLESAV